MALLIFGVEGNFTTEAAQASEVANQSEHNSETLKEALANPASELEQNQLEPEPELLTAKYLATSKLKAEELEEAPQKTTEETDLAESTQAEVTNDKQEIKSVRLFAASSRQEKFTPAADNGLSQQEVTNDKQEIEPTQSSKSALVQEQPATESLLSQVELAPDKQEIEPAKYFANAPVQEQPATESLLSQVELAPDKQEIEPTQSSKSAQQQEQPAAENLLSQVEFAPDKQEIEFAAPSQIAPVQEQPAAPGDNFFAQVQFANEKPQVKPINSFTEVSKANFTVGDKKSATALVQPITSTTQELAQSQVVNNSNLLAPSSQQQAQATPSEPAPDATAAPLRRVVGTPQVRLQGVYLRQGEEDAARARVSGIYPFSPHVLVGATVDLTSGEGLSDSREGGLSISELYVAASPPNYPNLRFVAGQMDLTSYFDRNSFAKDGATHFFNPVFQTNPALSATSIASRPGALVTWAITDDIETKAAVFSSSRNLLDLGLDSFAGEVAFRFGNAIIRGTYVNAKDSGTRDGFQEIFQIRRNNGEFGISSGDREESYGINGEVFIPSFKLGLFGRYGRYENQDIGRGGDTYSFGLNFLDLFQQYDRLGLAYGRKLSNNDLRESSRAKVPDVLELFYDFRISPNLRLGFTLQGRDEFSETVAGVRIKTEFDLSSAVRRMSR